MGLWNFRGIVWGLLVSGSTLSEAAEPQTAKLATGESYKPVIDFHKPGGGPLVENVRKVFQEMGYAARIEAMPWKRAYLETQKTTYLATFPWYKDAEREKDFYFSDPLFLQPTVAVLRKNSDIPRITASTITGKVTCDILGSTIWSKLKEAARVRLVYVNDPAQCNQMLSTGRIDFMMMHPQLAHEYVKHGHKVVENDLNLSFSGYLIVSRQDPKGEELIQKFNQSMKKLMERKNWQPIFSMPAP